MNFWHSMVVFAAAFVADITWTRWTISANQKKPLEASFWTVGIVLLGLVNVDAYIQSRWYVIPSAAGAAIGTYLTVWHSKKV